VGVYTGNFTVPATPLTATQSSGTNISAITAGQTVLLACQNTTVTTDNSGIGVTITNTGSVTYSLITPFVSAVAVGAIFATQISAGATHSVAIDTSSKLFTWGLNSSGQLALNDTANRIAPVQVGLLTNYNTISAGSDHTMALDSVGTLYAWGLGTTGQLGDITAISKSSPVLITSISIPNTSSPIQVGTSSYSFICTGNNTTAAISSTNKLFVWGLGTTGQLGTGNTLSRSSPVQISANSYNLVNAGGTHTTFVPNYSPQLILATGLNSQGQLGLSDIISRSSPTQVAASTSSFNSPVTVSTGNYSSYYVSSPTQVGTSSWTAVSAGGTHTLGIKKDNTLYAWGYNANGQLGGSNTINRSSPVQVGTSSWSQVSAGDSHNIILKSDGTINTFGLNTFGQLGDGT
jgi:alpha-tubulin suppressor-like RCC1 family protein